MKPILITLAIIIVSAIIGNPVCWYLFTHTEYTWLAQRLGFISSITFLGGIGFLFLLPGYYAHKADNERRTTHELLRKLK